MTESYDFSDLRERWKEAQRAAEGFGVATVNALFLGSLVEDLREAVEELDLNERLGLDDPAEYRHEGREREIETGPIVLKGSQPVSLLNEICQQRGWPMPKFEVCQVGGESHLPVFGGKCSLPGEVFGVEDDVVVEIKEAKNKNELKKRLARSMLLEHFGAKEDY